METLNKLVGSRWSGKAELWLDPLGNTADHSDCTIVIEDGAIDYTWSHEGNTHTGSLRLSAEASGDSGADFNDTFHSQDTMKCEHVAGLPCLLNVAGNYQGDWGWRISLCYRAPTSELMLQMTNVAPWGEEGRAVRMTCSRDDG